MTSSSLCQPIYDAIGIGALQTVYAMFRHFLMTLPNEIISTETSVFLKHIIFLKSFNSELSLHTFNHIPNWTEFQVIRSSCVY